MSDQDDVRGGRLGFLDSLAGLFRTKEEAPAASAPPPSGLAKLEAFEAAVRALDEKVDEHRQTRVSAASSAAARRKTEEERAAERERRVEAAHRAMREDIEKLHAQLGTGITGADLDAIAALLQELDAVEKEGKDSHSVLPRVRYAIAEKLRAESGELAVARLVGLMEHHQMSWPELEQHRPSATPEEIEGARRRRLADLRRAFLGDGFARTGESMRGIIKGWGADYPDRGSRLWQSTALESVAAGIRGQLLREFVEFLRGDREQLLSAAEATVGKELQAVQAVLAGGVASLQQANVAVASALRVLDEVVPTIAWEHLRARLPAARGERG